MKKRIPCKPKGKVVFEAIAHVRKDGTVDWSNVQWNPEHKKAFRESLKARNLWQDLKA